MAIRWADIPHREIGAKIYARVGKNALTTASDDASQHILRRRLRLRAPKDHRRFIKLEARDVVKLLRCTRDAYREFVEENQCTPLNEAYWVILRFAILPTAIAVIRQKVIDYLKMTQVAGIDLSLLFGVQTRACNNRRLDDSGGKCDPNDRTPASDTELRTLSEYVKEDTLAWFPLEERGVWIPIGGGPFAVDDESSIRWSWGLCALKAGVAFTDWLPMREKLWHKCTPWTEGLTTLFRCAQDELLTQWKSLSPDSQARELKWRDEPANLEEVVVQATRATEAQEPNPETVFDYSESYRSIHYLGERYTLTRNQGLMLRVLYEAHETGHPDVDKERLLEAIENETSKVRDSWKSSRLWQKLVISGQRKGTYRLNLPSAHRKSAAKIPPLKNR